MKYLKDAQRDGAGELEVAGKASGRRIRRAEDPYRQMVIREKAPTTPAVLKKAGIKFALYSDGLDAPRDLQRAVKKAIDNGLVARRCAARADAFAGGNLRRADRLGRIEKGKIANLVVTQGRDFRRSHEDRICARRWNEICAGAGSVRLDAAERRRRRRIMGVKK